MAKLLYQVIDKQTGRDASERPGGCPYVVTPSGKVAWWDDSAGWSEDDDQDRYEVKVLEQIQFGKLLAATDGRRSFSLGADGNWRETTNRG